MAYEAPWIRAWRDFLGDAKVLQLTLAEEGAWWRLLLLANSEGNVSGNAMMVAPLLRMGQEEAATFIGKLIGLGMTRCENGHIVICHWKERQYFSDYSTPRVQRFREKKRSETLQVKRSETGKTRGRPEIDKSKEKNTRVSAEELVKCWNAERGPMKECRGLDPKRSAAANSRLRQFPDLERWRAAIRRAAGSAFCTGQIEPTPGHKRFFGHFDWLVQPNTLLKIEEGMYDNDVETAPRRSPAEIRAEADRRFAQREAARAPSETISPDRRP